MSDGCSKSIGESWNVNLDDQPYDEKALDDESTCLALYDIVMAKTKEKAEEWNGTIDVTLIFVRSHLTSSFGDNQ